MAKVSATVPLAKRSMRRAKSRAAISIFARNASRWSNPRTPPPAHLAHGRGYVVGATKPAPIVGEDGPDVDGPVLDHADRADMGDLPRTVLRALDEDDEIDRRRDLRAHRPERQRHVAHEGH